MNQARQPSTERLNEILDEYSVGFPELRASLQEPAPMFRHVTAAVPGAVAKRIPKDLLTGDQGAEAAATDDTLRRIAPERIVALAQGVRQ